jgi:GABA(A) receptor-associated protein
MTTLQLSPEELARIQTNYPGRIPIFVSKAKNAPITVPDINKKKFLAPADLVLSEFVYVIRKRIALKPEQALFIFINDSVPNNSSTLGDLYSLYKKMDGSLHFTYTCENTFG